MEEKVAPFTGAWIETAVLKKGLLGWEVAPFTGAWIETIVESQADLPAGMSLPSRERGLKRVRGRGRARVRAVAPFTGAWIETRRGCGDFDARPVAPFTGAWIETGLLKEA